MHSVLFFAEVLSHRDEGLDAEDAAGILVINGELSKNREQFLDYMLLIELLRKYTKFSSAYTSDTRRVFLA